MKVLSIQGWQVEVDEEATRRYYAQAEAWDCDCGHCRNFLAQAETALPESLRSLLDQLGIDPTKAGYLCQLAQEGEQHRYQVRYPLAGRILERGQEAEPEECREPDQVPEDALQPRVDLEAVVLRPWVLSEPVGGPHQIVLESDVEGTEDFAAVLEEVIPAALAAEGVDLPCDVLSFPMFEFVPGEPPKREDADLLDPGTGLLPLGDMVFSLDRIRAQAVEFGHSERRELSYLAVHSALDCTLPELLEELEEEDSFFYQPLFPYLRGKKDGAALAKGLADYYNEKEREAQEHRKQINDCILYHLFENLENCSYPFWEIEEAILPGSLEGVDLDAIYDTEESEIAETISAGDSRTSEITPVKGEPRRVGGLLYGMGSKVRLYVVHKAIGEAVFHQRLTPALHRPAREPVQIREEGIRVLCGSLHLGEIDPLAAAEECSVNTAAADDPDLLRVTVRHGGQGLLQGADAVSLRLLLQFSIANDKRSV